MPDIVVATLNVHGGVDGWGRPFDVAEACRQLDADVLAVQELWSPIGSDAGAELAAVLGCEGRVFRMAPGRLRPPPPGAGRRWGPRWPRTHLRALLALDDRAGESTRAATGVPGTIGFALLSRLPVREVDSVDLGRMPGDQCRRGALLAELDVAGCPLLVAATHMSHLRHFSPVQFRRLHRALPPRSVAAALLGDMNLWGPPLELLVPGFARAVRGRTWPAWRPLVQSDHVLVTPPVAVRRGELRRVGNTDHLAVRATLALG